MLKVEILNKMLYIKMLSQYAPSLIVTNKPSYSSTELCIVYRNLEENCEIDNKSIYYFCKKHEHNIIIDLGLLIYCFAVLLTTALTSC